MKVKAKNVKDYMAEAFLELLKYKNIDEISIVEICDKANIGRSTFYRNYKDKQDVIRDHLTGIRERYVATTNIYYDKGNFKEYIKYFFEYLSNYKELSLILYRSNLLYLVKEEFDKASLERQKKNYNEYECYYLAGGIFNLYYCWVKNGFKDRPEKIASLDNILK